jgi:hypothetical protein
MQADDKLLGLKLNPLEQEPPQGSQGAIAKIRLVLLIICPIWDRNKIANRLLRA